MISALRKPVNFLSSFICTEFLSKTLEDLKTCFETGEQLLKHPGCSGYIGDYAAQLYGDYHNPFLGSLIFFEMLRYHWAESCQASSVSWFPRQTDEVPIGFTPPPRFTQFLVTTDLNCRESLPWKPTI